jgi:hypothetical protein
VTACFISGSAENNLKTRCFFEGYKELEITVSHTANHGPVVMDHPCYTPDFVPSDIHLFQRVKKNLDGKRFATDANVKQVVISCLQIIFTP